MKKKTTIVFIILVLIAAGLCTYGYLKYREKQEQRQAIVDKYNIEEEFVSYDASSAIEKAKEKYDTLEDGAKVIRDDEEQENTTAALVFAGVNEKPILEEVLNLLDRYKVKATFCIEGSLVTEDDEIITLIKNRGHIIADNALYGDTYMENLTEDELIENFATSNKIISVLQEKSPNIMMCNSTFYADNVTKAAKACGYDKLISASAGKFINAGSFKDYKNAKEYTSKLTGANILVVKINGYLDSLEYEVGESAYSLPPQDMKATIGEVEEKEEEEEKPEIATTLNWLLEALKYTDVDVVSVDNMKATTDTEYVEDLIEKGAGCPAETVSSIRTVDDAWGLAFVGLPNEKTAKILAEKLVNAQMHATFFVDNDDVEQNPKSVKLLSQCGFKFGSRGYSGEDLSELENMDIYHEFFLLDRKVKANEGKTCKYYCPPGGKITDNVKKIAGALGYTIYIPETVLSGSSAGSADFYTKDNGSIYCLNASDGNIITNTDAIIKAAQNSGKKLYTIKEIIASSKSRPVIDDKVVADARKSNDGQLAQEHNMVYTTEKAFSFAFFGISNKTTLTDVLNRLEEKGYTATFFATYDEYLNCQDQVEMILEKGHEMGLAYTETKAYPQDFDSVAKYLLAAKKYISWQYEYEPTLTMMPFGEIMDETKEAMNACGLTLIGREITLVQGKFAESTDIDEFYYQAFHKTELHRGSIVYVNMNVFTADKEDAGNEADSDSDTLVRETVTGKLLSKFIRNKVSALTYKDVYGKYIGSTMYKAKSLTELMNSNYIWSPRGGWSDDIRTDKNVLTNTVGYAGAFPYIKSRYLGNYNATGAASLPGFSEEERPELNTSGKFTEAPVIFLTFDDWGTDYSINQLLYVLKKYNVKATFFVKTKYVSANPNLLRAIAADGHQIGSHTNDHLALADEMLVDPVGGKYEYTQISMEEAETLRNDLVKSYRTLNQYVGNVKIGGKKALSLDFRPPTLAVSRLGLYEVFDVGFQHSVSGDFSTNDYEAPSLDSLISLLQNGRETWDGTKKVGPGSIVVMHMTDTAQYTAEALDIMIPIWQSQGYSFARIDDYLH